MVWLHCYASLRCLIVSRLIILLIVATSFSFFVSSCGGGSDTAPEDGHPISTTPTPSGWERIQPQGIRSNFALPKPVGSNIQEGVQTFAGGQGTKTEIYVSIFSRGQANVEDPADELAIFEKGRLDNQTARLAQKGFTPEMKYEKDLAVADGLGQQIRMNLGEQYIFNQFYMTPDAFYHVKIDNADESNPVVKSFMESFSVLN